MPLGRLIAITKGVYSIHPSPQRRAAQQKSPIRAECRAILSAQQQGRGRPAETDRPPTFTPRPAPDAGYTNSVRFVDDPELHRVTNSTPGVRCAPTRIRSD
ncbi:hypothetical protein GCM10008961_15640 [Deinococcus knuensis]|uniref:Uncharacterized protein n=1 Tax=Deinococcus knuensis TaxID=1837380 RepID=A0ABQ2SH17_9DEIO|nr:hypothetical protein GCM10008961_15640 [Deinococcus knuensis]